mmetsp:Transcript_1826/g.3177  ORF Transcript_1826/g.3177 Transcript_1826/m.3177 type:complete len:549 (-) Transcript_1826:148-1794(-)
MGVRFKGLRSKYHIRKVIGVGATSAVVQVTRKSDHQRFAVKIIHKAMLNELGRVALAREVAVYHCVRQENVLKLEEILEDANNVYIVTELLVGGDLRSRLVNLSLGLSSEVEREREKKMDHEDAAMPTSPDERNDALDDSSSGPESEDDVKQMERSQEEEARLMTTSKSSAFSPSSSGSSTPPRSPCFSTLSRSSSSASSAFSASVFSLKYIVHLAIQMVSAIKYLHEHNIAHRDIKLENFVFSTRPNEPYSMQKIKLVDFGLVYWRKPGAGLYSHHPCGTIGYAAPEIFAENRYIPEAADMWSLGVVLYILVTGRFPIDPEETEKWIAAHKEAKHRKSFWNFFARNGNKEEDEAKIMYMEQEWKHVRLNLHEEDQNEADLESLVKDLLHLDPQMRPTAAQTYERLVKLKAILDSGRPELRMEPLEMVSALPEDGSVERRVSNIKWDQYESQTTLSSDSSISQVIHQQNHVQSLIEMSDAKPNLPELSSVQMASSHPGSPCVSPSRSPLPQQNNNTANQSNHSQSNEWFGFLKTAIFLHQLPKPVSYN